LKRKSKSKAESAYMEHSKKVVVTAFPVICALTVFLASALYIAYRMVSDYNYNERWKDYDECGLG